MSRVLVTGGVGALGAGIVRRLLADPNYDVRVADSRPAPQWMRETCELRGGEESELADALRGCSHAVHIAVTLEGSGGQSADEFVLLSHSVALDTAILRAAIEQGLERLVYVSPPSASASDPGKLAARALAALVGERLCEAARSDHGLELAICRVENPDDPGAVEAAAVEVVAALR